MAGVHPASQRCPPALHGALELAAFRQRDAETLQRVGIVLSLRERLLEPGDRLAMPALSRESSSHPFERGRPLRLQGQGGGDAPLSRLRVALRKIDLREREMGLEGGRIDRQQLLASLAAGRQRPLSAEAKSSARASSRSCASVNRGSRLVASRYGSKLRRGSGTRTPISWAALMSRPRR